MTSFDKSTELERIGIIEVSALGRWVHARCGKHFRVKFDPYAPTAYVDTGFNMVIPALNVNATKRDLIRLRGFCIHECGHPEWQPDIFDVLNAKKMPQDSPLAGIYNLLTDVHSESLTAARYPGDAKALSEFAVVVGRDLYERLSVPFAECGGKWPTPFATFVPMVIAARNVEATWNIGMEIGFSKIISTFYTAEMVDKAKVLVDKFNLVPRIIGNGENETAWTLFDLALDIFKYMYPDENPEDHQGGGKPGDEKGEKGEGEGELRSGAEEGEGEEPAEKSDGDEDSEGKAKSREKIKLDELLFSDHYERYSKGEGTGVGFDYADYKTYNQYTPVDPTTFKVISYRNKGRR